MRASVERAGGGVACSMCSLLPHSSAVENIARVSNDLATQVGSRRTVESCESDPDGTAIGVYVWTSVP